MASEHKSADLGSDQKYWAFISYSQRDARWAQRLHAKLERYRVPRSLVGRRTGDRTVPRRLIPMFRDRSELASAADLAHEIREALQSSRSLIIVCSPHSAVSRWVEEEIRTFKVLGRGERIFPLIIDGEPNAPDGQDKDLVECFAPSLRFDFKPDGTRTKTLIEPIAADARPEKDGWRDACLKLIAGILNVRFDELRRRELRRQRHRRLGFAMAAFAVIIGNGLGYVGLADADLEIWGSAPLQRQLDRYGWSVFRRIPAVMEIFQASDAARDRMRRDILAAISAGPIRKDDDRSVWEIAQVSAAVLRDPSLSLADFRTISRLLDGVLVGDIDFKLWNEKRVGWADVEPWPRAEPALWMIMALSAALQRNDLATEAERLRFVKHLGVVQEMAESYHPLQDGGWNMFPFGPPKEHFAHTTGLALHALLQLHSTGLCWRGDCDALKKMIADTARWLTQAFVDDGDVAGWRRGLDDELSVVSDLSIPIFGSMVRAHLDVGAPLSDRIESSALQQLTSLRLRSYLPAYQNITNSTKYTDKGQPGHAERPVRLMWYPWAIEGLVNWLQYAERKGYPPEMRRALERSLGHVLISLSSAMLADMARAPKWVQGETYYGLASVQREVLIKWLR
jgi:hypothetical protein